MEKCNCINELKELAQKYKDYDKKYPDYNKKLGEKSEAEMKAEGIEQAILRLENIKEQEI